MNGLVDILQITWVNALVWSLFHSLWQSALLFLVTQLTFRLGANHSAHFRYRFLIHALLLWALFFGLTFFTLYKSLGEQSILKEVLLWSKKQSLVNSFNGSLTPNPNDSLAIYLTIFLGFWIIGVLTFSMRLFLGFRHIHQLRSETTPISNKALSRQFDQLIKALKIPSNVKIYGSKAIFSPLTFGYFKPIVLLPISLLSTLSIAELELVVAHELMHIKRKDYLVNILQSILEILFFFNPLVWWFSNAIKKERENCCDDDVIALYDPKVYVKVITQVEANRVQLQSQALYLNLSSNKNLLLERVKRITQVRNTSKRSGIAFSLLIFCLLLSGFLLLSNSLKSQKDQSMALSKSVVDYLETEKQVEDLALIQNQLQCMDNEDLTLATELLAEKHKQLLQAEQEAALEMDAILASTEDTSLREVMLVKKLFLLEKSEQQIEELEQKVEEARRSLQTLNYKESNPLRSH